MSKVSTFRRRRGGPSFFLPVIGCAILLMVTVLLPDDQATTRQDASTPRILKGGSAWKGGNAQNRAGTWTGNRPIQQAASAGAVLTDTVTRIRDGDTIVVGSTPIRIANLDCAERGSTAGDRATRQITSMVAGVQLRCALEGRRSYDREVGVCSLPDGRDIGKILITGGYCQRWRG